MSQESPDTETETDSPGATSEPQESSSSGSDSSGDDSVGISDDQLPEDLQPTDDNPLAKPPSDEDEDSGMSLDAEGPGAEGAPPG